MNATGGRQGGGGGGDGEPDRASVPHAARPWLRAYPGGTAWDTLAQPGTLTALFDGTAASHADRPFLDFLGRRWTYRQGADAVARAAGGLRALGVGPGDRVGLCLPNTPYAVIAFFAVLRAGGVVVNFSPLAAAEEMAAQVADSGATVMICSDLSPSCGRVLGLLGEGRLRHAVVCRFAGAMPPLTGALFGLFKRRMLDRVPSGDPRVTGFDALRAGPPLARPGEAAPGDLAVLQYTGGTTGTPKAVMLTHANLVANARQVCAWFPSAVPGHDKVLAVLPLFHVFALTTAMTVPVAMGAEIVLLPRFDYRQMRAALRRCRPTIVPGVPTLFKALLDRGIAAPDLASVKVCISGGAPLPHDVQRQFDSLLSGGDCVLVEGYGLTEASPVCFCNPVDGSGRAGTIGLPLPGIEARIRAPEAPDIALPPGTKGELQVRGPNVMQGYYRRPEETAAVLSPDGWLRTGDVGEMDADGYVTLVDRIKDLILCGGFNVYPRHVEEAIYRHPDIAAVTVLGMPDAYRGESVAAFVQRRPGSTLDAKGLLAFLKDRLSPVEMPRRIEFRSELPRTAVGKLSRKELRAELLGEVSRDG
jgi:long-chain acyl-CoA synthetase